MNNRKKNSRVYLEDILAAILKIVKYTAEGKDHFFRDPKTQDAVLLQLSVIGEAAAKLPTSLRADYADVPWKKIIGLRNIIIHDYSNTDIPTIWLIVERDLPIFQKVMEAILGETIGQ